MDKGKCLRVMEQVFVWDPFTLSWDDSIHKMMVKIKPHVPLKRHGNDTSHHWGFNIMRISAAAQPQT